MILFCGTQSCSRIEYRSKGEIPVFFTGLAGHAEPVDFKGKEQFFLWGLLPNKRLVNLDRLGAEDGFKEMSKIQIKEYQSLWDLVLTVMSLGVYIPRSYEISGYGRRL